MLTLWYFKCVWALPQVSLGAVPRGLGYVPRRLDQPGCQWCGFWHITKFCFAQPKLLATNWHPVSFLFHFSLISST
ncbi:hypothetical protein VP01_747g9 [Puccinia sorghi]|uniref:Uncharacterized protein n=1 Tax=Puccinia sorghi TaxID=27349 RepID=A0A0L6UCD0_9BASI|nr:hypothetical protein VP01_747g9 [Puccinia sorghi]